MTEKNTKDLLTQLSDLSEAAIQRIAEAPGADKVLTALKKLGERVDELQRRTKGYEELEHRLAALEKKVSGLAKSSSTTSSQGGCRTRRRRRRTTPRPTPARAASTPPRRRARTRSPPGPAA